MSEHNKRRFNPENRTPSYEEAVKVLKKLAKEESVEMVLTAYAEATTDEWEKLFAKKENAKKSRNMSCITQLITGNKCQKTSHLKDSDCYPPANDHSSLWVRENEAVSYTSEPYELSFEDLRDIVDYCNKNNLRADLNWFSPHYPGRTFCVKYRKNEK